MTLNRKLVLRHTQGPLAGMAQIFGNVDQLTPEQQAIIDTTDGMEMGEGRTASVVKRNKRMVLYRENESCKPESKSKASHEC